MTFDARRTAAADRIGAALDAALADYPDGEVRAAMRYAVRGGKRLRGFLVLEAAALHGVDADTALPAACAIEALHAYSLVHDDLPAMDDDDLRRGQPTVHKAWDEATAILVGDALQTFAFGCLTDPRLGPAEVRVVLSATLARAAGAGGMVLGQAQDMAAGRPEARAMTLADVQALQANKTGALIKWSAEAGARIGGADPGPLGDYAAALGLAFQIADDILDVEGESETAGKRLRKDAEAGKATFVSLLGLDAARARAETLVEDACAALDGYGPAAGTLRQLARFVISRRH